MVHVTVGAADPPKLGAGTDRHSGQRVRVGIGLILILGSLSAFGPLSTDMYLPSLPMMTTDLHTSATMVQLTLTTGVFGLGAGQLVVGPVSDAVGRRKPLLVGLAFFTVFSATCALAPTVGTLVVFRLLQTLGGASGLVIARAVVRDLFSGRALARFFSMLMLVMGVAPIAAPLLGGQLIRVTSWRGVFVVLTAIGVVLLVASAAGLPETLPGTQRNRGSLPTTMRTYLRLVGDRGYLGALLAGSLGFGAMFAYISGSSFVLENVYGLSAQLFSVVFGVNGLGIMLAGQITGHLLVDRIGTRRVLAGGLCQSLIGGVLLLLAVLAGWGLPVVLIALFLTVSSVGVIVPTSTALAMSSYREVAGSASALFGVAQFATGGLVAPLVGLAGSATALPMAVVIAVQPLLALIGLAALGDRGGSAAHTARTD